MARDYFSAGQAGVGARSISNVGVGRIICRPARELRGRSGRLLFIGPGRYDHLLAGQIPSLRQQFLEWTGIGYRRSTSGPSRANASSTRGSG